MRNHRRQHAETEELQQQVGEHVVGCAADRDEEGPAQHSSEAAVEAVADQREQHERRDRGERRRQVRQHQGLEDAWADLRCDDAP